MPEIAQQQAELELIKERERRRLTSVSRAQWWRYENAGTAPDTLLDERAFALIKHSTGLDLAGVARWPV